MKKTKIIEEVEIKKFKFKVELEYYYDEELEEYFVDEELGNANLRKIRNEYRRLNGLLLDYNIKQIREKYKLSQKDFAFLLGMGEVTITRYESKSIHDKSQDQLIRNAANPELFLEIVKANKEKFIEEYNLEKYNKIIAIIEENIINNYVELGYKRRDFPKDLVGNQELNIEKICGVIKVFSNRIKTLTKTKLAKLLWYADFLSFNKYGKGITGLTYCHLPYGAVPFLYEEILNNEKVIIEEIYQGDLIKNIIEDVKSNHNLDENELIIIEQIVEKFKDMDTEDVVKYMHKEKAYLETRNNQYISYNFAKDIIL